VITFLTDLDVPFTEHGRCGDLDAGGMGDLAERRHCFRGTSVSSTRPHE
jgi:hypothetical protein